MNARDAVVILARMFNNRTNDHYPKAEAFLIMLMDKASTGETQESCNCCIKKFINEVMHYNSKCTSIGCIEINDRDLMDIIKVIVE